MNTDGLDIRLFAAVGLYWCAAYKRSNNADEWQRLRDSCSYRQAALAA